MNEMEKQIQRTFNTLTQGLEPSATVREKVFLQLDNMDQSYSLLIRIPVAVSFFTTIMAVPISVY